jgi:hypothetical protein
MASSERAAVTPAMEGATGSEARAFGQSRIRAGCRKSEQDE